MLKRIQVIILLLATTSTVVAEEKVEKVQITTSSKAFECMSAAMVLSFDKDIIYYNDMSIELYKAENPEDNYEDWLVTMGYNRGLFDGKYMERATNYMMRNDEVFTDEKFKNTLELQALAFYSSNCE